MAIVFEPGITVEGGILIDNGPQPPPGAPSYGTTFDWTPGSYFNTWTGGSSTTTSALGSGGDSLGMVWTMYYAWQAITIPLGTSRMAMSAYKTGTGTGTVVKGYYSTSTIDNTLGSFGAPNWSIHYNLQYAGYTGGSIISGSDNWVDTYIPANRYFLIGVAGGINYRAYKTQASNYTGYYNGSPVMTVINKIYWAPTAGPITGIPTQLGGDTAGYTEYNGYVNLLVHSAWSLT